MGLVHKSVNLRHDIWRMLRLMGVLREFERRVELVKGNLLSQSEAQTADHQVLPLAEHIKAYATYLETCASSQTHRKTVMTRLRRLTTECKFEKLADLDRTRLEAWVAGAPKSMSARTKNGYITALVAFCNWAVEAKRLIANPFSRFHRANETVDRRHERRAMTEGELTALLDAAQRRPLAEHGRKPLLLRPEQTAEIHKPKRATWTYEPVTPDTLADCESRARDRLKGKPETLAEAQANGRLRALDYKTLALTGLRLGELRSLTVGQAILTGTKPYLFLKPADEKARRGAEIPLRADLAKDLAGHLAERLRAAQRAAARENRPLPARLPDDTPLLIIPGALDKVLNRDLVAAGIATPVLHKGKWQAGKRDPLGRTVDVHCLRTTFNSLLAAAGVPLTTRRILMRHSGGGITDKHYTDATLIDLHGTLDKLPRLPLEGDMAAQRAQATGTDGPAPVCSPVYKMADNSRASGGMADATGSPNTKSLPAASVAADKPCESLTYPGQLHRAGVEPATFGSVGRRSIQLS